jgi:uncharacterized protein YdeI (YjbR/CyaY-like superfamily)
MPKNVRCKDRATWRAWLERNHASASFAWLQYFRKGSGRPSITYSEAVEEALCFGWIDSKAEPLEDSSWRQYFCPRKPGSAWSKLNKQRVERMIAEGLMREPGLRIIEAARANGSWGSLDAVEALEIPDDFAAALDALPGAREFFDATSRTNRKQTLYLIASAKRAETRAQRIAKAAEAAGRRERLY